LAYSKSTNIPALVVDGESTQTSNAASPPMEQLVSVAMLNISHNFAGSKDNKSTAIVKSYLKASLLRMNSMTGNTGASPASTTGADEKCEICDSDIPFESLTSAKCLEGHEFGKNVDLIMCYHGTNQCLILVRCALTFLAIQAPGISNFCGICSKQYLSEAYLDSDSTPHMNVESDTDSLNDDSERRVEPPSLARTLFAACETCVYCGGRFVG
jgi:hypothetical protein